MRSLKKAVFVAGVSLAVLVGGAGCAHGPSAAEAANADYGSAISQSDAQELAQRFMAGVLKDPASATYEWGTVSAGYIEAAPLVGQKMVFGYQLDALVNSKNSYGGYTGRKKYQFMFRNGALVAVFGETAVGSGGTYMGRIM